MFSLRQQDKSYQDSSQAWFIVLIMGFYFCVDLCQASMVYVIRHGIEQDIIEGTLVELQEQGVHQVYEKIFGWLTSMFSWGSLILVPFVGLAINRYAVRRLTLGMLLLCIIGAFGTLFSTRLWMLFTFRAISGISHAFCFLCASTLINRWFSIRKRGIAMSTFIALGLCGLLYSSTCIAPLTACLGSWRYALIPTASVPVLLLFVAFFVLEDYPEVGYVHKSDDRTLSSFVHSLREALSVPSNIMYPLVVAFVNVPIAGFLCVSVYDFFAPYTTLHLFGLHPAFFISLGNMVGSLTAGWIVQRCQSYNKPLLAGALISLLIMGFLPFSYPLRAYTLLFMVLALLLGFASGMQVAAYPAIGVSNKPHLIEPAMTIASFIIVFSMAAYPALSGELASRVLLKQAGHIAVNYPWNYLKLFSPLLVSLVSVLCMVPCIKEHHEQLGGEGSKNEVQTV